MSDYPILSEAIEFGKQIRDYGADAFGPWYSIVSSMGQTAAAAIAVIALVAGRSFWSPPTPNLEALPVRLAGFLALVGVGALYVWSKNGGTAFEFLLVAAAAIVVGIAGAVVYLLLRAMLTFKCRGSEVLRVRGLWVNRDARAVLNLRRYSGTELVEKNNALPESRRLVETDSGIAAPKSASEYFCNSWQDPDFVWPLLSYGGAQAVLFLTYLFFMAPVTIAVAAVSLAVTQPQVTIKSGNGNEVVLELPADVLFDFGSADIRRGALPSLEKAAELLRTQDVKSADIAGYADALGDAAFNKTLSESRAKAVRDWLEKSGELKGVALATQGYGASHFVAPNSNADGSDNPAGRAKNRRVSITFRPGRCPCDQDPIGRVGAPVQLPEMAKSSAPRSGDGSKPAAARRDVNWLSNRVFKSYEDLLDAPWSSTAPSTASVPGL